MEMAGVRCRLRENVAADRQPPLFFAAFFLAFASFFASFFASLASFAAFLSAFLPSYQSFASKMWMSVSPGSMSIATENLLNRAYIAPVLAVDRKSVV